MLLPCNGLEGQSDIEWAGTQLTRAKQDLQEAEERRYEFLFHRQASWQTQVGDKVLGKKKSVTGSHHSRLEV